MDVTGLKTVGAHRSSAWCWVGVVDTVLLSSLEKDYSENLPLFGLQRMCPDKNPINDRKPLHSSAIPSRGPEQPTMRHKPPGCQASLGLALTALLWSQLCSLLWRQLGRQQNRPLPTSSHWNPQLRRCCMTSLWNHWPFKYSAYFDLRPRRQFTAVTLSGDQQTGFFQHLIQHQKAPHSLNTQ